MVFPTCWQARHYMLLSVALGKRLAMDNWANLGMRFVLASALLISTNILPTVAQDQAATSRLARPDASSSISSDRAFQIARETLEKETHVPSGHGLGTLSRRGANCTSGKARMIRMQRAHMYFSKYGWMPRQELFGRRK